MDDPTVSLSAPELLFLVKSYYKVRSMQQPNNREKAVTVTLEQLETAHFMRHLDGGLSETIRLDRIKSIILDDLQTGR
jgi:hypothetical protein